MLYWRSYLGILMVFNFGCISSAPTLCNIPNTSNKGHCVQYKDCKTVPLTPDFLDPDAFENYQLRRASCQKFLPDTVCCEINMYVIRKTTITTTPTTTTSATTTSIKVSEVTTVTPVDIKIASDDENSIKDHVNFKLFDLKKCGKSAAKKVANGENAGILEHPWAVRLGYTTGRGIRYNCGGSLISEKYILTAAHCVTKLPSGTILTRVILGDYNTTSERDCDENGVCAEKIQEIEVEKAIPHPNYEIIRSAGNRLSSIANDIALIRLSKPAKLKQKNIRTICLPFENNSAFLPKSLIIIGWGATQNATKHEVLQKAIIPLVNTVDCQAKFKEKYQTFTLDNTQICAGGEGKVDACKGDSGGPLMSMGTIQDTPRTVQYGVVSFGLDTCGIKDFPGVYAKVDPYLKWILDSMEDT